MKSERLDRLRMELEKAKEKANQWQAKIRDLEKQIRECEDSEILRMVHTVAATPEELHDLLKKIQAATALEIAEDRQKGVNYADTE